MTLLTCWSGRCLNIYSHLTSLSVLLCLVVLTTVQHLFIHREMHCSCFSQLKLPSCCFLELIIFLLLTYFYYLLYYFFPGPKCPHPHLFHKLLTYTLWSSTNTDILRSFPFNFSQGDYRNLWGIFFLAQHPPKIQNILPLKIRLADSVSLNIKNKLKTYLFCIAYNKLPVLLSLLLHQAFPAFPILHIWIYA